MYRKKNVLTLAIRPVLLSLAMLFFVLNKAWATPEQLAVLLSASDAMQARFVHVMRDSDGEVVDESSGSMAWLKPDKFRWDIKKPLEQTLVVDGDTYYQFDRDLDQLLIETVSPEIATLPSILLSGDKTAIEASYTVEAIVAVTASDDKKNETMPHIFKLKPTQDDAIFVSILLEFDGDRLAVLSVEDDLDNISRFEFYPFIDNAVVVTAKTFELQTSESTEIVRQ